jgi:hypothetical protein
LAAPGEWPQRVEEDILGLLPYSSARGMTAASDDDQHVCRFHASMFFSD